jgi:hypothetical protein
MSTALTTTRINARGDADRSMEGNPVLVAITDSIRGTLESIDPRRFVLAHSLSKTAQQFIRAVSMRVEDFGDLDRLRPKAGFFKTLTAPDRHEVAVPADLGRESIDVLDAMTRVILSALDGGRPNRFAQVERLTETAQAFVTAIAPLRVKRPKSSRLHDEHEDAEGGIVCGDPEAGYVQHAMAQIAAEDIDDPEGNPIVRRRLPDGPEDVNQLRRDVIAIKGTRSQMEAELLQAQIAAAEASELEHLTRIQATGGHRLSSTLPRMEQLKARLALRTKGATNAMVSADISRGHQPGRAATGNHDLAGDQSHVQREDGPREAPGEGAGELLGVNAVGEP